ncbi:MAG: hypothetical protein C5B55_12815 [Blastocatellia bacterium]|nr:MAG: hypothetical protein C5B55_12815 [Blastocatellia bacterium]
MAALVTELSRQIQQLKSDLAASHEQISSEEVQLTTRGIDFYREVERFEIGLIRSALRAAHGNQTQAAKHLRINPTTLNAKMKHYGVNSLPWIREAKTVKGVDQNHAARFVATGLRKEKVTK